MLDVGPAYGVCRNADHPCLTLMSGRFAPTAAVEPVSGSLWQVRPYCDEFQRVGRIAAIAWSR